MSSHFLISPDGLLMQVLGLSKELLCVSVPLAVGDIVGVAVGYPVGTLVGLPVVGVTLGWPLTIVGASVAGLLVLVLSVGTPVSDPVGDPVGALVGNFVGASVTRLLEQKQLTRKSNHPNTAL